MFHAAFHGLVDEGRGLRGATPASTPTRGQRPTARPHGGNARQHGGSVGQRAGEGPRARPRTSGQSHVLQDHAVHVHVDGEGSLVRVEDARLIERLHDS